ncbi:MAG TPA: hypothetical protein VGI14_04960 [Casimicrobiaceae bacterium]
MKAVQEFELLHVRPKPGRVLIAGSRLYQNKPDRRLLHADAVGVDMADGPGVNVVADLETEQIGAFAHIECMSVLEHAKRPWKIAANLERMMVKGGTIYITAPFVWKLHGYPDDYWRFTINGIKQLFQKISWEAEAYAIHGDLLQDLPFIRHDDWPHAPVTETCLFGRR